TFQEIFDNMNVELPWVTEMVLGAAGVLHAYGVPGVAIFAAIGVGAYLVLTRFAPRLAPSLVGGASSRRLAELSRALGAFLRRGVPADRAFRALAEAYRDSF